MTLDQLKVLVAIVETGSFRGAAENLHRAQSAISYGIKSLEDSLDLQVFDRRSYRPKLTQAGQALYRRAKSLTEQADDLAQFCTYLAAGNDSQIRLSLSFICPLPPIMAVLSKFSQKFPETNLNLAITNMQEPIQRVLDDEAEIAISDLFSWHDDLHMVLWRRVRLLPVCSPDYPLARESLWGPSQKAKFTQIVVSTTPDPEQGHSAAIITGAKQWVVTQFAAKTELLKQSLGWGFMPDHLISTELAEGSLVGLKTMDEISRDFYISRKKDRLVGDAQKFIWEHLTNNNELSNC